MFDGVGEQDLPSIVIAFLTAFFIAMIIAVPYISLMRKVKARQTILCYVEQHKQKEGVPTMGGTIFLAAAAVACLIFWKGQNKMAVVALVVTVVYGGIGALDDGIKIIMKRNLGLRAYQKIISQSLIAVLATYYCYKSDYIGSEVFLPILNKTVNLSRWYFPLGFLIYIATTNCVNLTDGLDGLAGTTVAVYLGFVGALVYLAYKDAIGLGQTFYAEELRNVTIFAAALIGGILGFLWHNSYKASIFMGDTGSLALGGACAVLPMMIKKPFVIPIVGIMFVVSGVSVIVQVAVYKLKRKRVFLMAPFHHHLEMKGKNESKIVAFYAIITVIAGAFGLIISYPLA